jgi:cAMP-dependent protein kinase regulator
MKELKLKVGGTVIQQGDNGEEFFIVDEGQIDCFRVMKKGEQPKYLKTYFPGESFGELALLYNAPRAATLKAKSDAILFVLDRKTFNHVIKESTVKKRERYEDIIADIEILSTLEDYERCLVINAGSR